MTQPDLVIFDFDGTLVDSEILAAQVEADLLTRSGFPITGEEISGRYAGLTFKDIMLRIEEESRVPFKASLIDEAEVLVDRRLRAEVRLIEGAKAAVAMIDPQKCICSNSRSERIRFMMETTGIDRLFGKNDVFSSLDTPSGKPKPAPDVFLHAAESLPRRPRRIPSSSRIRSTAFTAPRPPACASSASPARPIPIPAMPIC